jgi:endonuclease YncB( thermonuclease family)
METATYSGTQSFQDLINNILPPGTYRGRVVKVYDGDTFWIAVDHNGALFRTKIRMRNIDTPEIRGGTPDTKKQATDARDLVAAIILHEIVTITITGMCKYGRHLAFVYPSGDTWKAKMGWSTAEYYKKLTDTKRHLHGGMELNEYLLGTGHAVPLMYAD